tara:strand:- start:6392 stop:7099 length:708 start_codon:yes stop_codon:yes gene_type:complete
MKLNLVKTPFNISNQYYSYQTLGLDELNLIEGKYYLLLQFSGRSLLKNFTQDSLNKEDYIEFIASKGQSIRLMEGICVVLSKDCINNNLSNSYKVKGKIKENSYFVNKPWGYEYWITSKNPINDVVLKYIHIKKGTKTSLQVHQYKYESNFLVEGEAILRFSDENFSIKKEYEISEINIKSNTVIDVAPLEIHQLESITDIYLLEASTNHLDDVIRLKDDTGRGDGKIKSEHSGV